MNFTDRAVIQRAGTKTDPYTGETSTEDDWSNPVETSVGCEIQPTSSVEVENGREIVVSKWRGYFYADTDITPADRVAWQGLTFTVDGDVEVWRTRGATHHLEVPLRRVN